MYLEIVSPDKTFFKGDVSKVSVPGAKGRFTVLPRHAPIISILDKGDLIYFVQETENRLPVVSGLVEVKNDRVTVCVDTADDRRSQSEVHNAGTVQDG
jgi:F-type H+-transporting ATPase subunit epsilon